MVALSYLLFIPTMFVHGSFLEKYSLSTKMKLSKETHIKPSTDGALNSKESKARHTQHCLPQKEPHHLHYLYCFRSLNRWFTIFLLHFWDPAMVEQQVIKIIYWSEKSLAISVLCILDNFSYENDHEKFKSGWLKNFSGLLPYSTPNHTFKLKSKFIAIFCWNLKVINQGCIN